MATNMSVVRMEKPIVSQADLANIIVLRNQIERSKQLLLKTTSEAVEVLRRGGEVEIGINSAELQTDWNEGKLILQLRINGAAI